MNEISHGEPGEAAKGLGKYQMIASLGRGGMADVDLALCRGSAGIDKLVVIKRVRPELAEDPRFLAMFLDEARLAAKLNHPNVIQTYEAGDDEDGHHYMAMEYLAGQPLNRILLRFGPEGMPLATYLRVLADVCAGLHYAHELADFDGTPLGVVHRDISPQNVFITYDGVVKVVDFGIAKAHSSRSETQVGMVKGKVTYMAPEQASLERVDRRADIFSVGVMLWEAATGTRPWLGKSDATILKSLLEGQFPSPRMANPHIAPKLEAIVLKATARDREKRHATAAELQADIEAYLEELGAHVLARDIGKAVADRFASDRARMKATIEAQLQAIAAGEQPVPAPAMDRASNPSAGSRRSRSFDLIDVVDVSSPRLRSSASAGRARSRLARRLGWASGAALLFAGAIAGASLARPLMTARSRIAAAAMLPSPPQAAMPATPATATGAPAPATEARPAEVLLDVTASPADATIYFDARPVGKGLFKAYFPRDGKTHELRIAAPGYTAWSEEIVFDRDREIERSLAGREIPSQTTAADPASASHASSGRAWVQRAGEPPRRQLDGNNPYAKR